MIPFSAEEMGPAAATGYLLLLARTVSLAFQTRSERASLLREVIDDDIGQLIKGGVVVNRNPSAGRMVSEKYSCR